MGNFVNKLREMLKIGIIINFSIRLCQTKDFYNQPVGTPSFRLDNFVITMEQMEMDAVQVVPSKPTMHAMVLLDLLLHV
jgi:hypothetical protein